MWFNSAIFRRNELKVINLRLHVAPVDTIRGNGDPNRDDSLSPKPMTPRRVKRRSVRGTSTRQSRRSDRAGSSGTHRSSTRNSRRKVHQNPVTKLMDQQNSFPSFKHNNNPTLTENNLKSLNNDYVVNSQYHHQVPKREIANLIPSKSQPSLNSFQKQTNNAASTSSAAINRHTPTDPIYYNMNSSSPLIVQQTSWNATSTPSPQAYSNHYHHHHPNDAVATLGHTNPTYQHSNPNLADGPEMNEYYQTARPPSVRSSYSNFHGTRPLSYNQNPTGSNNIHNNTQENLFASLTQQQQQQQPPQPTRKPQQHQQYYQQPTQQQQIIPNAAAIMKRAAGSRESLRFLSGAPPAYNHYNHHTPPDSETTM
ncbi:CLUMA_CG016562, isoform A [Clunio marinus]|uniref:CLUMA_CG016562, isoform A n=1 Tax=Clunio marinus TaxID=568069 RepID=A0A1J1IY93_9DIPT|nr:CLUMA_CG016562, isoform A [Clunio marinus]